MLLSFLENRKLQMSLTTTAGFTFIFWDGRIRNRLLFWRAPGQSDTDIIGFSRHRIVTRTQNLASWHPSLDITLIPSLIPHWPSWCVMYDRAGNSYMGEQWRTMARLVEQTSWRKSTCHQIASQAPETLQVFMTCVQRQNLRKIRKNVFNPACTVCEKDPVGDCEQYVNYARSARTAETALSTIRWWAHGPLCISATCIGALGSLLRPVETVPRDRPRPFPVVCRRHTSYVGISTFAKLAQPREVL